MLALANPIPVRLEYFKNFLRSVFIVDNFLSDFFMSQPTYNRSFVASHTCTFRNSIQQSNVPYGQAVVKLIPLFLKLIIFSAICQTSQKLLPASSYRTYADRD